jgi:hypothetical protein
MKKISNKKLALVASTVRVLDGDQLEGAGGAGAQPTTTVLRHGSLTPNGAACRSVNPAGAVCRRPSVNSAIVCRLPPG